MNYLVNLSDLKSTNKNPQKKSKKESSFKEEKILKANVITLSKKLKTSITFSMQVLDQNFKFCDFTVFYFIQNRKF